MWKELSALPAANQSLVFAVSSAAPTLLASPTLCFILPIGTFYVC